MDTCVFCGLPFGTCSHLNRFGPATVTAPEPDLTEEQIQALRDKAAAARSAARASSKSS